MDLKQLRIVVAVSEERSITRAALHLRLAQPAVSQHIRNLEAELGVDLFIRSSRGVQATEAGERLVVHARKILDEMVYAADAARGAAAEPKGHVRLGMPGPISEMIGVPLVRLIRARHPAIQLHLVEAMSGYVLEWLRDGRVDIALLYVTEQTLDLPLVRLLRERLHLIAPATTPPPFLDPSGAISFKNAAALDLVLPGPAHGLRMLLEKVALQAKVHLVPAIETESYPLIKGLVSGGLGYGILPAVAVGAEAAAGRLRAHPIVSPCITREIALAYASSRPPPVAVTAVERACRDVVEELTKRGAWPACSLLGDISHPMQNDTALRHRTMSDETAA